MCKSIVILDTIKKSKGCGGMTKSQLMLAEAQAEDMQAMKKELQQTNKHVGVVSGGDFIQGNSLGVISQGEYIIKLMNLVGYDAVTLGNHEFDCRLERL